MGGALEGRARLVREVTRAVSAAVPRRFLVGVRLSPEDFGNAKGLDLDESIEVARWLCDDGADFIHLSLWDHTGTPPSAPRSTRSRFSAPRSRGRSRSSSQGRCGRGARRRSFSKGASAVALGRAAIANPDWPHRIEDPNGSPGARR